MCLVFDELKVKSDLVYDKHSAELMGFVRIGEINDYLSSVDERNSAALSLATHMLTCMVSGSLSNLEFRYISFPCSSMNADELYFLVWGVFGDWKHWDSKSLL